MHSLLTMDHFLIHNGNVISKQQCWEMGFWSLLGRKECRNLLTAATQWNSVCSKCLKTIVTLSVSHFCVIETNSWGNFIKRTGLFWLSCRKKYLIRSLLGPAWPGLPPNPPTFRTLVYFPIVYRNKGKGRGWGLRALFQGWWPWRPSIGPHLLQHQPLPLNVQTVAVTHLSATFRLANIVTLGFGVICGTCITLWWLC